MDHVGTRDVSGVEIFRVSGLLLHLLYDVPPGLYMLHFI